MESIQGAPSSTTLSSSFPLPSTSSSTSLPSSPFSFDASTKPSMKLSGRVEIRAPQTISSSPPPSLPTSSSSVAPPSPHFLPSLSFSSNFVTPAQSSLLSASSASIGSDDDADVASPIQRSTANPTISFSEEDSDRPGIANELIRGKRDPTVAALYPYFRREESRFAVEASDLFKLIKSNIGTVIETFTASFLRRHLPRNLGVFNGIIFDLIGSKTHEVDAVVVDGRAPLFPIDTTGEFHLVPVESVIAAIEIKSSASEAHLRKAITQLANVKALQILPDEGDSHQCHQQPPLCCVLLASGSIDWKDVERLLIEFDTSKAVDFVGIIGSGCAVRSSYPSGLTAPPGCEVIVTLGEGACSAVLSYLISRRPLRRQPLPKQYYSGKYYTQAIDDNPAYLSAWHIYSSMNDNHAALHTALDLLEQVPSELRQTFAFTDLKFKIERKLTPPDLSLGLSTGILFKVSQ